MNVSCIRLAAAVFAVLSTSSIGNAEDIRIKKVDLHGIELGMDVDTAVLKLGEAGFIISEEPNSMATPGKTLDEKGRAHSIYNKRFTDLRDREDTPIGATYIFENPDNPSVLMMFSSAPYGPNGKFVSMSRKQSIDQGSMTGGELIEVIGSELGSSNPGCVQVDHFGFHGRWITDKDAKILEIDRGIKNGFFCKNSLGLANMFHISSRFEELNNNDAAWQIGFEVFPPRGKSPANLMEGLAGGFSVYFTDLSGIAAAYEEARQMRKAELEAEGKPSVEW